MVEALRDLGYHFNEKGQLRDQDNQPFKFTTQAEYVELGDAVTEYIYDAMEKECGLLRKPVRPLPQLDGSKGKYDDMEDDEFGFVFISPDFEQKDTVLVLIHGSGAVRAGQWGRKLIINESLDEGSQLPYIRRALRNDWGVLVVNANDNHYIDSDGYKVQKKFSNTPPKHCNNAWARFVHCIEHPVDIHVVAHSAGGSCISEIMRRYKPEGVKTIILTDSWYSSDPNQNPKPYVLHFSATKPSRTVPFVKQRDPTPFYKVYAGTPEHDRTSATCFEGAFFAMENLDEYSKLDKIALWVCESARRVRGGWERADMLCQQHGLPKHQWYEKEIEESDGEGDEIVLDEEEDREDSVRGADNQKEESEQGGDAQRNESGEGGQLIDVDGEREEDEVVEDSEEGENGDGTSEYSEELGEKDSPVKKRGRMDGSGDGL